MGNVLQHYGRLVQQRRAARSQAARELRPDQLSYYEHLLKSWGYYNRSNIFGVPVYGVWNPESAALRKTLEQRP